MVAGAGTGQEHGPRRNHTGAGTGCEHSWRAQVPAGPGHGREPQVWLGGRGHNWQAQLQGAARVEGKSAVNAQERSCRCDAYSVRRVWSGRRRCENKRKYDKYYYAPGAAGDGVRTSADSATCRLAPGLCTRA
jgi:hypothetical protein